MLIPNKIFSIKVEGYGFLYVITYEDSKAVHITTQFTENEISGRNAMDKYTSIVKLVPKTNMYTTTKEKAIQNAKRIADEKKQNKELPITKEEVPASKEEISKMLQTFRTDWEKDEQEKRKNWYRRYKGVF